ncbi:MAG: PAS domain S-box protein, partial [Deltaproteobacteria bacterium]|nr:PAS domain S-box protein [Deltaproteobacteria bacterium]
MLKLGPFSKVRNKLIFSFVIVALLLFFILSAYHFHLCTAALKQQTLSGSRSSEYLMASIDPLKTKMLLSILVVSGLAAIVLYGVTRKIMNPLSKMTDAVATLAKTGDLSQPVEVDTKDEMGHLSRSFQDTMHWMKEMAGILSSISDGNLDQKVDVKSEKDTFGRALQSMIVSLKNSQEALQESEEKFRKSVTHAPIGLSILSNGSRYEYVNPKFVEMFGYTLADIPMGQNWFEKAYPDSEYRQKVAACWKEDFSEAKAGKARPRVFTVTCKNGSKKEILFKRVFLTDGNHLVTHEDITERKLAEQVLQESEEKYRTLFDGSREPTLIITKDETFVDVNAATVELLGYNNKEELMGIKSMAQLYFNPEDQGRIQEILSKQDHVKDMEQELRKKDGGKIYALLTASTRRNSKGNVISYKVTIRDITDRKQAEEALRESEEKFRAMIEGMMDGVCVIGADSRFKYVNEQCTKIYGFSREELIGRDLRDYLDGKSKRLLADREDQQERGIKLSHLFEVSIVRKDEGARNVEMSARSIKDTKGDVNTIVILKDVTERKQAEEVLQRSEEAAKRLAQENAAMAEIGQIISSTLNINDIYDRFAEEVRKVLSFDRVSVTTVNPDRTSITIAYGFGVEIGGRPTGTVLPMKGAFYDEIVNRRTSVLIQTEDEREIAARHPAFLNNFRSGLRSIMGVPLVSKDQVIGILNLQSVKPNAYTEANVRLAER